MLLENVAALLTRGLDRVLGELGQIGYDAEWHCIPAAAVGAPHIRDRVFVIAYASEISGWRREEWETISQLMDRLRCLGNAVVPQVAEWIGRCILTDVDNRRNLKQNVGHEN